ncbi:MAG: discoidin domain-containing protein [bacterium]|nr:discoidin domain-containing protein [bacterium]
MKERNICKLLTAVIIFILGFSIRGEAVDNLALNRPVTASSTESGGVYLPSAANDGNATTRWASVERVDPQWLMVDLGGQQSIDRAVLKWETAYASGYQIQVSTDSINWQTVYSTSGGDGGTDDISFTVVSARYVRMYGTQRYYPRYGYSIWEMEVYGSGTTPAPNNLALNKAITASSVESASLTASRANDGSASTRWASIASADPQWLMVDLGAQQPVGQVILKWETAYANGYQIQVSTDSINWQTVYSTSGGDGGTDDINFAAVSARYVRMYGTQRYYSRYGYSIWEMEVYGSGTTPLPSGNLALSKAITATSVEDNTLRASCANDGSMSTRWASVERSDPQWLMVDLGGQRTIARVVLKWETAYASGYQIQVSTDSINWQTVYSTSGGDGGTDDISFTAVSARYVRMYGTQRYYPHYGYSIWEMEVYEQASGPALLSFSVTGADGNSYSVWGKTPVGFNPAGGTLYPICIGFPARGYSAEIIYTNSDLPDLLANAGYIFLAPESGANSWGNDNAISIAEAAAAYVAQYYCGDTSRQAAVGFSMGGGAAITYAVIHPDRVKTVAEEIGWTDMRSLYDYTTLYKSDIVAAYGGTPTEKPVPYAERDLRDLSVNLKGRAVYIRHGDADINIPYTQSTYFRDTASANGAAVTLVTVSGGTHYIGSDEAAMAQFIMAHTADTNPADWSYKSYKSSFDVYNYTVVVSGKSSSDYTLLTNVNRSGFFLHAPGQTFFRTDALYSPNTAYQITLSGSKNVVYNATSDAVGKLQLVFEAGDYTVQIQ